MTPTQETLVSKETLQEIALEPCPFCGGEAYEDRGNAVCESCCATLPAGQWNRRTISPELRRLIIEEECAKLGVEPAVSLDPALRNLYKQIENLKARLGVANMGRAFCADEDIRSLADRFLTWPLPATVAADMCATEPHYQYPRSGTNLLSAVEARQMVKHLLEGHDETAATQQLLSTTRQAKREAFEQAANLCKQRGDALVLALHSESSDYEETEAKARAWEALQHAAAILKLADEQGEG